MQLDDEPEWARLLIDEVEREPRQKSRKAIWLREASIQPPSAATFSAVTE